MKTKSPSKHRRNNPSPFELPKRIQNPGPSKNATPFETPPAWLQGSALGHPCVAEAPVRQLNEQVILLGRQVEHLQDLFFKALAELIHSGVMGREATATWLGCPHCREHLAGLLEDFAKDSRVH